MIQINAEVCIGCGGCIDLCPAIALSMRNDRVVVDHEKCIECKICVQVCPLQAPFETQE